jgi:2,5-dihydroxypyridine 5,6-dioxygenase
MGETSSIPRQAAIAIGDMLDNCAELKPGQDVLIVADASGLHGGDNCVDELAISWIKSCVNLRGANASVLWIDEPAKAHEWRLPPILKGAMSGCDLVINNSFDLTTEDMIEWRDWINELGVVTVKNMATTAPLLCSAWARTPYELVSEIRYRASLAITVGATWQMTSKNGTDLEGTILPSPHPVFPSYSVRRKDFGYFRPWPEWVHPPVALQDTSGVFVFESMLSWWSRYARIPAYFAEPISLTIDSNQITKIEGGNEAAALRRFLEEMRGRLGDGVYNFDTLHFGVHPQAAICEHQCPNPLIRRMIDHAHSSNLHVHIGAPGWSASYPYWMHCTGDIRTATLRIGDQLLYDEGHLSTLDDPAVVEIAAKYEAEGRPGLTPLPLSY